MPRPPSTWCSKPLHKKTGEERKLIEQIEKLQGLGAEKSDMRLKAQQDNQKGRESLRNDDIDDGREPEM
jgi:hypothetical protein